MSMGSQFREHLVETRYLMREVNERIGEALAGASDKVRVAVAREVVKLRAAALNNINNMQMVRLVLAEAHRRCGHVVVAMLRIVESCSEPIDVLYATHGIEFGALVELEQVAQTAVLWGWTGRDLRRLGLELAGGA